MINHFGFLPFQSQKGTKKIVALAGAFLGPLDLCFWFLKQVVSRMALSFTHIMQYIARLRIGALSIY